MKFSKTKIIYVVEYSHRGDIKVYSASKAAIVGFSLDKHDNTKRFRSFDEYFKQLTEDTRSSVYFTSRRALLEYTKWLDDVEACRVRSAFFKNC